MDITEAFRAEDISKTDFFDFVVAPDVGEAPHSLTFNRTLKSMGIFIENTTGSSNNNNASGQMSAFQDLKETNNNHLVMTSAAGPVCGPVESTAIGFSETGFWSSPPQCDKETVRLDTAILEDLNTYCWSQDSDASGTSSHKGSASCNTDGAIYTLTVLNGSEQTVGATWYRPPDTSGSRVNKDDGSATAATASSADTQHSSLQQQQQHQPQTSQPSALDFDSILNIMPGQSQNPPTASPFHPNGYHSHNQHHHHHQDANTLSPHQTIHQDIKSEQYSYDHISESSPMMDTGGDSSTFSGTTNNNNNDWKISDNNNSNVESLLRSALQGKGAFQSRYNGVHKNGCLKDGHAELKRALSTPPGSHGSGSKTPTTAGSPSFLATEADEDKKPLVQQEQQLQMFDDSENHSSGGNSMDDILLSQLDAASYPEDYEKLKRIANEVAESVSQFCGGVEPQQQQHHQHSHHPHPHVYMARVPQQHHEGLAMLSMHHHHHHMHPLPSPVAPPAPPGTPSRNKKYAKKQSSGTKTGPQQGLAGTQGVRKERSLHYCNICSKGFKDKYSVNVHIRTHTGEKPFSCTLCGKSFRQKAHLAKHYQTHIAQKNGSNAPGGGNNGVSKATTTKSRYPTSNKPT